MLALHDCRKLQHHRPIYWKPYPIAEQAASNFANKDKQIFPRRICKYFSTRDVMWPCRLNHIGVPFFPMDFPRGSLWGHVLEFLGFLKNICKYFIIGNCTQTAHVYRFIIPIGLCYICHRWIVSLMIIALTLNVRGPNYLGLSRSISWYWLCEISKSCSYTKKDFNYLWYVRMEEWQKIYVNTCLCFLWII